MSHIILNKFILSHNINLFFLPKRSLFLIKGIFGFIIIRMPSWFFFELKNDNFYKLLFLNRSSFYFFFNNFISNLNKLSTLFFFRLRIKGLGYRIRKISNNLFRFFFTSTNFFYFHIPANILIKYKLRRMLFISNNLVLLKTIIAHLLLLKKIIPYFLRGIFSPRNIIILKPGKKAF